MITVTAPLTTTGINASLAKGYLISGTITGSSGPLSGVSVRAYRGANTYYDLSRSTGSDGAYQLGPLGDSQYRLYFYSSDGQHASEWYSDSASYTGSTAINLRGNLGDVNAELREEGRITGTVTGDNGEPLKDLWVYAYPVGNTNSVASGKTDANGHYATSPGLASGEYQVKFSAPLGYTSEWYGNSSSQQAATAVSVTAGETTSNINARLASYAYGTITGTVTAADTGLPVSTWVYAYSASGLGTWSTYASAGSFLLSGLPPDAYRVLFSSPPVPYISRYYHDKPDWDSADLVTVTAGLNTPLTPQTLQSGGTITGTVTSPGGGVPGVYVTARRIVGGYYSRSAYTSVEGEYHLEDLLAGQYTVEFEPPSPFLEEWYDGAPDANAARTVTVTLSATTPDVNGVLETGGVITGLITAADTGAPLPGAYVEVYSRTGSFVKGSIYADMAGHYRTPGLAHRRLLRLLPHGAMGGLSIEWYEDARSQSDGLTVTVTALGTTPAVNAALERGGSISGWTYNAIRGWPLNGVYVTVYSATTGSYVQSASSNNGGLYQVNGLASGRYKVYFSHSGYKEQWYNQVSASTAALTVTVSAPDEASNIDAHLQYAHGVYLPLILRSE